MAVGNEHSGSAGKVVQVGEVMGDFTVVTYARNDDIGVDLRHEDREVHLLAGAEERFYVTVTNRSDRARRLRFRVEGATGLQWEIVSDSAEPVTLPADGEIQVRLMVHCTPTAPMAGAAEVKVLVGDEAEGIWWPSNPKPVFVEPAPRLGVALVTPDVRVAAPGTYEIALRLTNEGNTALPVELVIPTDFDGFEHPEWLDSTRVRVVDGPSLTLDYGDPPVDCRAEVSLPDQGVLDQTWNIPLRARVNREDAAPIEQSHTILQHGLLSDLREWGRTEVTRKRRTLAAWAAIPLAAGIALGTMIGGPPSAPEKPPVQAIAAETGGPELTPMPCTPGDSVLVLHSLKDDDSAADIKLRMDFETLWVRQRTAVAPALKDHVARLSTRDATCPAVLGGNRPTSRNYTRFVWIGPFPSDSAPALCEALLKVVGSNCIPARVT
jgi:hypothetical protein